MKNYDNFNFEEELRPLLENYLSAANFIARDKTNRDKMIFCDLRTNDEIFFYNQKYEKILSNTLDIIINPFIEKLLRYQEWEYRFCHHVNRKEAFEFAFIKEGIGYAVIYDYSKINENDLLRITNTSKILNVINDNFTDDYVTLGENSDTLSLKYFFKNCLGVAEEEYNKMADSISYVYKKAVDKLSISVKRKISDYSINEYRDILRQNLYEKYCVDIINLGKDLVYYDGEDFSKKYILKNEDILPIAKRFKMVYGLLCNNRDYSVSFVTAEYLYGLFEEGMCMDYTPIILGYVKALEQLYRLVSSHYGLKTDTPGNMKPTFGVYINSICQNLERISFKDPIIRSRFSRTNIGLQKMLESFNKNARCDFIHKTNISDKEIVRRIRNNARVLIFLTVGGLFKGVKMRTVNELLGDGTNLKYVKFRDFISKTDSKYETINFYLIYDSIKKGGHFGKIVKVTPDEVWIEDNKSKKIYTFNESSFPVKYESVVDFYGGEKKIYGDISTSNDLIKSFNDFHPGKNIEPIYKVEAYFEYYQIMNDDMTEEEWQERLEEYNNDTNAHMIKREDYEEEVNRKPDYHEYEDIKEVNEKDDWAWSLSCICMSEEDMMKKVRWYKKEFLNFHSFLDKKHKFIEETVTSKEMVEYKKYTKNIQAKYEDGDAHIHAEINVIELKGNKELYNGQF